MEPGPPALRSWSPSHWTTREVPVFLEAAGSWPCTSLWAEACFRAGLSSALGTEAGQGQRPAGEGPADHPRLRPPVARDATASSAGTQVWVHLTSFQSFGLRTNFSKVPFCYEAARNFPLPASSRRGKPVGIEPSCVSTGRDGAGHGLRCS